MTQKISFLQIEFRSFHINQLDIKKIKNYYNTTRKNRVPQRMSIIK